MGMNSYDSSKIPFSSTVPPASWRPITAVLGPSDPSGQQWRLLLEMLRIFVPLLERGWTLDLHLDKDGAEPVSLMGGDCNCPHPKQFDPSDGHGFSYIHADNIVAEGDFETDAEYALAVAQEMAEQATELEGKPKE